MSTVQEVLRRPKSVDILEILETGEAYVRELGLRVGGSATTVSARIADLEKLNLIQETRSKTPPYRRRLKLTKEGERVVRLAARSIELMDGNEPRPTRPKGELPSDSGRLLLSMVFGLGGRVRGSTRFQKYVFLFQKMRPAGEVRAFQFTPYTYGPFSRDLGIELAHLRAMGLLDVEAEVRDDPDEDGNLVARKNWSLTTPGVDLAESYWRQLSRSEREDILKLKSFESLTLEQLLANVYERYPAESFGASREK